VLGFLGPNGAGKSTTMRMITGFLPPTSGKVTVGGFDMAENPIPAKRLIGYLPENAPAYTDMTVHGFLNFAAEIRGLRGDAKKSAINRVVEMCFLKTVLHQNVDTLSKGYRHRTCFAQSIIHDPDILVWTNRRTAWTRTRSTKSAAHPQDGREEGDYFFDAHPGGSGRGLHAGHHH
jgi:ABC-2 type transport system ATP-binding protein